LNDSHSDEREYKLEDGI